MDLDQMQEFLTRLEELEHQLTEIQQQLVKYGINKQFYLKQNLPIRPGVSCKVSYDASGLIRQGLPLDSSDIPELPMSKIIGLEKALESFIQKSDLDHFRNQMSTLNQLGSTKQTGIKVNVDERGRVVSLSELSVEDIPELPIDHIQGLAEFKKYILDHIQPSTATMDEKSKITKPGTASVVTYNESGQILSGRSLTIEDLPIQVQDLIQSQKEMVANMVNVQEVSCLKETAEAIPNGEATISLPISIDDVHGLKAALYELASRKQTIDLATQVTSMSNALSNIMDQYRQILDEYQSIQESMIGLSRENQTLSEKVTILQQQLEQFTLSQNSTQGNPG